VNDSDKATVLDYSDALWREHGYSPKALGWKNGRHNLRYRVLLSKWKFSGESLLDFGCGFGDMHKYCARHAIDVAYEGIDINSNFIEAGRKAHPKATLETRDALRKGLSRRYDYIVSSGVHNFKVEDHWRFIQDTFNLFNQYANKGFALNFLSNKVEYELEHAYHADPGRILNLAYEYSNRVVLRNDYMPFEFTIFVDKRVEFDREYAVYPEYLRYVK